jgi:hypothetical protein
MLMEVAEQLDLWCQEMGNPAFKPLKGRILKRRSRQDLTVKRKSLSGPQQALSSNSLSKSSGNATAAGLFALKQLTDGEESDDVMTLPESLESMKTGFLQFRRMQLKGQLVGTGDEKSVGMDVELAEITRLQGELELLKGELEKKKASLSEKEQAYFMDGRALALGFVEVAKHANLLGKGPLSNVFRDLQVEYSKALGLDDDGSSGSGDEAAEGSGGGGPPSREGTPSKLEKLTGSSSPAVKRSLRLERSDSTIGWMRKSSTSRPAAIVGSAPAAAPSVSAEVEGATQRFRTIVETLEAALFLNRPMDGVLDAVKEKARRLQVEIDETRAQLDNAQALLVQEEGLMQEVQANLTTSKVLAATLAKVSAGAGADELQQWIMTLRTTPETVECVKQLAEAQLHRRQTYFEVITKEYAPPRDSVQYSEDGSLFGARADVLFEMLISGHGAQTNADFENAFMYGFRAWIAPVSLLQRLIEAFCTTPNAHKSAERTTIHLARVRVLRLLSIWIDMHEYDVSEKRFSALMHSFLETVSIAGYDEECKRLKAKVTGNLFYDEDGFDTPYPASVVPPDLRKFSFLDVDPLELARQITLQDAAIYQGMQTRELLDCQWTKAGGSKAPTVQVITKRFNSIAAWVVGVILREDDVARRAKVIENFIKTAEHLLELQNFNGVMQLIASLSKTEIVRLAKTHAAMSRESRRAFDNLHKLLDKNCARLRDLYKEANPPCLPYIGTFMTDLTFIGEMKPRLPNGMINYRKLQLQASSLDSLLGRRGRILYKLKEVKEIRDIIGKKDVAFASEEEAYQRSLLLEPRDSGR